MRRSCLAVLLLLSICGVTLAAGSGNPVSLGSGPTVSTSFSKADGGGCIVTAVSINAGNTEIHDPPALAVDSSFLRIVVTRTDKCNSPWEITISVDRTLPLAGLDAELQFGEKLMSAALQTTPSILVHDDVSDSDLVMSMDLAWTATEDTGVSNMVFIGWVPPWGMWQWKQQGGPSRGATVNGSFTIDGDVISVVDVGGNIANPHSVSMWVGH